MEVCQTTAVYGGDPVATHEVTLLLCGTFGPATRHFLLLMTPDVYGSDPVATHEVSL